MTLRTERSPHLAGGMSHGPLAKRGEDAYVTGASEGYFTPCNSKTLSGPTAMEAPSRRDFPSWFAMSLDARRQTTPHLLLVCACWRLTGSGF